MNKQFDIVSVNISEKKGVIKTVEQFIKFLTFNKIDFNNLDQKNQYLIKRTIGIPCSFR